MIILKRKRLYTIILLLALVATTLVTISGFGESLRLSTIIAYAVLVLVTFSSVKAKLKISPIGYALLCFLLFSIGFVFLNSLLTESRPYKLTNFVSIFLIVGTVSMLSKYDWANRLTFSSGTMLCVASLAIVVLFWPGMYLSGWNPNSSIFVIPILLTGLSILYLCIIATKKSLVWFYAYAILGMVCIWKLENRSSIFTLAFFSLYPLLSPYLNKIVFFRILYIICIASCSLTPFLQNFLAKLSVFREIIGLADISKGEKLFNGREDLWNHVISQINRNPLYGTGGIRDLYTHNLALDVLTQYGWLGWVSFIAMVVYLIEVSYQRNCIFLYGFVLLFVLNTYENALVGNGFFTIFPYLLVAIAWNLKKQHRIDIVG